MCLTADDLLGLNYLYPVCTHAMPPPASCYKSERNIGWLRFALWVLLPVLVACAVVRVQDALAPGARALPARRGGLPGTVISCPQWMSPGAKRVL